MASGLRYEHQVRLYDVPLGEDHIYGRHIDAPKSLPPDVWLEDDVQVAQKILVSDSRRGHLVEFSVYDLITLIIREFQVVLVCKFGLRDNHDDAPHSQA